MANRKADAITMTAEEDILKAKQAIGAKAKRQTVGKAVIYGDSTIRGNPGMKEAGAGDEDKFAGVIKAVSGEQTRDCSMPYNIGDVNCLTDVSASVERNCETVVLLSDDVDANADLKLGANGTFQLAGESDKKVGRAYEAGQSGQPILAYIFAY